MTETSPSPFARSCGACNVCCTALGVEELKKYPATRCDYLRTSANQSHKCCAIYDTRPTACARFHCAWIEGLGNPLVGRPDRSGIMIVVYPGEDSPAPSAVVTIIDPRRSGSLSDQSSQLYSFTMQLLQLGFMDIKIINRAIGSVIYIKDGLAYTGHLAPQEGYEDLKFTILDPPIGKIETQEEPSNVNQ